MKPPSECDREKYVGQYESRREAIQDRRDCGCLCCQRWLAEWPDELIKNTNQTTL